MQVRFLGTSASPSMPLPFCTCEVCRTARHAGGQNLRRRSSLLIDERVLIDLGPDIVTASFAHDISLTEVHLCLQTHPHEDHFDPELIISRHAEYGTQTTTPLALGASQSTLEMMDTLIQRRCQYGSLFDPQTQQAFRLNVVEITPFERITIEPYHIVGYPANHARAHEALLYSIECGDRALFYGTDTAILFDEVWRDLVARGMRYDLFILDHTYGIGYATTDHLAADEFIRHVERIAKHRLLKESGRIYATHLSHEGLLEHEEMQRYAHRHGYHIAHDGLTIRV